VSTSLVIALAAFSQERHVRLTCLVACLIIVSTCAAQAPGPPQPRGRIIGSVVNDINEPIGYATLCTSIVRTNSANTSCGQKADRQGDFDIDVPLETNRVFARKPDAGYQQEPSRPMDQGVQVKLTDLEPVAHVTVQIGPRPAEIELRVTDKATGKPVDRFTVRWMQIDDRGPGMFIESAKNRVFVPPNVEVLLMVQAHGYERWFFTDVTLPSHPVIRLSSGEQRTIDAELEPQ
jgi:hypothetical protein